MLITKLINNQELSLFDCVNILKITSLKNIEMLTNLIHNFVIDFQQEYFSELQNVESSQIMGTGKITHT